MTEFPKLVQRVGLHYTRRRKCSIDTEALAVFSSGVSAQILARSAKVGLRAKGWDGDLHYEEAEGAGHNEQAWAARFGRVLEYLFPTKNPIEPRP